MITWEIEGNKSLTLYYYLILCYHAKRIINQSQPSEEITSFNNNKTFLISK